MYEKLPEVSDRLRIIRKEEPAISLQNNSALQITWEKANSILIVCGQFSPDEILKANIKRLTADSRVIVIAEPISNINNTATVCNPEVSFNSKIKYPETAIPDLVINIGGQVVSKKIKIFLRGLKNSKFYRISTDDQIIDTFQNITSFIVAEPHSILKELKVQTEGKQNFFKAFWEKESKNASRLSSTYINKIGFSDLLVFNEI